MSNLLLDEPPLILLPSLANRIGLNEAIILQQLHFLLRMPKNGKVHKGKRWIYNTYAGWRAQYFPFWSEKTIERILGRLEKLDLVESCQPEGRRSRRKHYRLNEEAIQAMCRNACHPAASRVASSYGRLKFSDFARDTFI